MPSTIRSNAQLINRARKCGEIKHPQARKVKQLQKSVKRHKYKQQIDKKEVTRRTAEEAQLFWLATAYRRLTVEHGSNNTGSNSANNPYVDKAGGLHPIVVEALVHIFIERNDEQLARLRNPARGNPPRGQIKRLEALRETEQTQFISKKGFRVPPFADRADVTVTLDWLDVLIELDEHRQEVAAGTKLPALPPATVLRVSVRGDPTRLRPDSKVQPTDDFMTLVTQLKEQEGIGAHFAQYDESDGDNDDSNNENNDQTVNGGTGERDVYERFEDELSKEAKRRRRRRLFKVKKLSARASGAKKITAADLALVGMARRKQQLDSSRDKRRKEALTKARRETEANDNDDEDEIL